MIDQPLSVAVQGQPVGDLARSEAVPGDTSFRYRDGAKASQAVSLIMPVRRDDYQWQHGLHPVFEMNLPEGILRERLTQMFSRAIRGFDDLHLLSIVGPHQLGRAVIGGTPDVALPGTSVNELLVHDGAQGLFEDLLNQYARYSGVSGVQPKVLVRDQGSSEIDRVQFFESVALTAAVQNGDARSLQPERRPVVIDMGEGLRGST